ncbi:DNA polymerase I, partial [Achromatium sp. WMS2]
QLNHPILGKTPKGTPSTAESVLTQLAELGHELPKLILEYRTLSKLKSTYLEALPLLVNPNTGRIHTSYQQAVAVTGRLSSITPNLQNIPIRHPKGRAIRQAFIAPPGFSLLAADYSQIELRILAHLSKDSNLINAFNNGQDIHLATASELNGITAQEVTNAQRRAAKIINFGIIYGMSAFGLSQQLSSSRTEAQDYINLYFQRYPNISKFMEQTKNQAHQQGFVETIFGRRLYLPDINSKNAHRRKAAERTAINAPLQGSAADIIKRAMLLVDNWIQASAAPARILMQVHDELVLEVEQNHSDAIKTTVSKIMASAAILHVPLVVNIGSGPNWDIAH